MFDGRRKSILPIQQHIALKQDVTHFRHFVRQIYIFQAILREYNQTKMKKRKKVTFSFISVHIMFTKV